ncbi:MAG: hypothetical protein HYT39_01825 [Candidatus Sungbacteria bacterium]|nr:hypothetical protein [Candidatus Sungbacteria bacterium]
MTHLMALVLAILAVIGFGIIGPAPPPALADMGGCAQAVTVVALDNYYQPTHDQPAIALDISVKAGTYYESDKLIALWPSGGGDGADTSPPAAITKATFAYYDMRSTWATMTTAPRASPPHQEATRFAAPTYWTDITDAYAPIVTTWSPRRE